MALPWFVACTLVGYDPVTPAGGTGGSQGGAGGGLAAGRSGGTVPSGGLPAGPSGGPPVTGGVVAVAGGTEGATGGVAGDGTTGGQRDGADAGIFLDAGTVVDAGETADAGQACMANACGGCQLLSGAPGTACGTCGLGELRCDGVDGLACVGGATLPQTALGAFPVDDFEDGDGFPLAASRITGAWYTTRDSSGGWLVPGSGEALKPQPGGPSGSTLAARVIGGGFSDWGATLAVTLNVAGCGFDVTRSTGFEFDAMTSASFSIAVATADTVPRAEGGRCWSGCYDHFETDLSRSAWTGGFSHYRVPWTSLLQSGFGTPVGFDRTALTYMEFQFPANTDIDFWVDNVAFY